MANLIIPFGAGGAGGGVGFPLKGEITIVSGVLTVTGEGAYTVDTEADAASDVVTSIAGMVAGETYLLKAEAATRTAMFTHAGNLHLASQVSFPLNNAEDHLLLYSLDGAEVSEVSRSSNPD